jgi:hypothetical protein
MKGRILFLLLMLILVFAPSDLLAQGCSMCKAVADGEQKILGGSQSVGKGLNSGILYLMAVPYVLLFLVFRKKIVGFFREFGGAQG